MTLTFSKVFLFFALIGIIKRSLTLKSHREVAGTVVDIKLIAKYAIDCLASGVILAHNHPSGNLKPSNEDLAITKRIKEGLKTLDIQVLDHIILTSDGYLSFGDEGIL
jgi:DNA repair protein RadC